MSKRNRDNDEYIDESQSSKKKQKTNKKSKAISKAMNKEESRGFLAENRDFILENHQKGLSPSTIAEMLSAKVNRPGAVTNRQITNFIYQKKKAGQVKTYPVSGKNNNLRANTNSQSKGCM
jgi:hypothetical protein